MPATNSLLQDGRYRVDSKIPNLGTEFVYEAYDTISETTVILQEIPIRSPRPGTEAQRSNLTAAFANHAKTMAEVKHDSLVHVRDFFSEIGRQYVVTESVDGDDLELLLKRQKRPFPLPDVMAWADQLLDVVHHLHTHRTSIVHKNICPENITLTSEGKLKLKPFGPANRVGGRATDGTQETKSIVYSPLEQIWPDLDAASQKVIVHHYDETSERILKEDLDFRSDIYSLGATLYSLLTGAAPADALERSIERLEGRPDPLCAPNAIDTAIPPEISEVIVKAMEIKREYRFDSAAIMRQVLRTAVVRVAEREEQEARGLKGSNDIKIAEEKVDRTASPERRDETEEFKKKLQEAEDRRLFAEKRAAEAERKLKESEAARLAVPRVPPIDHDSYDDLLELLQPSSVEQRATVAKPVPKVSDSYVEESTPANENQSDDTVVKDEIADIAAIASHVEEKTPSIEESLDTPLSDFAASDQTFKPIEEVHEQIKEASPLPATQMEVDETPTEIEDLHQSSRGIPKIAFAAVGVLIIVIAVGSWILLSGPADTTKISTPEISPVQTAPSEPAAQTNVIVSEVPAETPASQATYVTEPKLESEKVRPATQTATKKISPAAAKTPPPKKAVTVDDLINDN